MRGKRATDHRDRDAALLLIQVAKDCSADRGARSRLPRLILPLRRSLSRKALWLAARTNTDPLLSTARVGALALAGADSACVRLT
jgi:hypothetical protein